MILQRIRIIVGDAGFEPGTSATEGLFLLTKEFDPLTKNLTTLQNMSQYLNNSYNYKC